MSSALAAEAAPAAAAAPMADLSKVRRPKPQDASSAMVLVSPVRRMTRTHYP
jgi:hypothetical protein